MLGKILEYDPFVIDTLIESVQTPRSTMVPAKEDSEVADELLRHELLLSHSWCAFKKIKTKQNNCSSCCSITNDLEKSSCSRLAQGVYYSVPLYFFALHCTVSHCLFSLLSLLYRYSLHSNFFNCFIFRVTVLL